METIIDPDLLTVYRERVAHTVALFDAADPTWREDINLDRLDMGDFVWCVSGQIRGRSQTALNPVIESVIAANANDDESLTYPVSLGLEVDNPGVPAEYNTLQHAWMEVLRPTA